MDKKEQTERMTFAMMIAEFVRGELDEVLKGAPEGYCKELGRIWDAQCHVPVGVLFNRPKFEEYEAMNKKANTSN